MFMDLDGFKQVNDVYGYQIGDVLLVVVVECICQLLCFDDVFVWLGGDEFVLVVGIDNGEDIVVLVSCIIQIIGYELLLFDYELQVIVSIGIVICFDYVVSEWQLMVFVDVVMYQVKEVGCNVQVLFFDWMNDSVEQQFQLFVDLCWVIGID